MSSTPDPETLAAVVEGGDAEDVDELIDLVEELTLREQLRLFDRAYETLLSCMELEKGDSREAAVRVVSALAPAMGRLVAETSVPDHATPGNAAFDDAIDRQAALYVAALADPDDGVRRAAVRGIESFSVACQMDGDRASLERLYDDLDALESEVSPEQREHIEEAKEHVFSKLG